MSKSAKKLTLLFLSPEMRQWITLAAVLGFAIVAILGQPASAQSVLNDETVNPVVVPAPKVAESKVEAAKGPVKEPVVQPSDAQGVRAVLADVCLKRGYGDECTKTLLGMSWKESQFVSTAVGDRGKARGYFQIHYKLHGISLSCAQDLRCSADWTITYLEYNNFKNYPRDAIQCHNGCNAGNGYAASVIRHGNRLWKETSAEVKIPLAMK
jgi:hypothetical protein